MNIESRIEMLETLEELINRSTLVAAGVLVLDAAALKEEISNQLLAAKQELEEMINYVNDDEDLPF